MHCSNNQPEQGSNDHDQSLDGRMKKQDELFENIALDAFYQIVNEENDHSSSLATASSVCMEYLIISLFLHEPQSHRDEHVQDFRLGCFSVFEPPLMP